MTPQKKKIDMSLDEIIKMNKKGSNKKFSEAKKSGIVKKTRKIVNKKIVKKNNPVEAARNRTRIAAAKLAANKQLKGAQLNNKATQKVIRTIVAEVLKSKSINTFSKTRVSGKSGLRNGRDKNKLNRIQRTSRVISKTKIQRPIRNVIRGGGGVVGGVNNSKKLMPSTNIFKSRLIAHKLRGNDKIPQNNGRNNGNRNNFKNKFDNRTNDRRPNQRSGSFKAKREHPSNFLKRNNGRY